MDQESPNKKSTKEVDFALIEKSKSGDYRAFDLLVLKYQSRIISVAFKFVKELHLAEDIAQESFIKAYLSLDKFRFESSFYTWIYQITSNTAKNYLTKKYKREETLEIDFTADNRQSFFDIDDTSYSPAELYAADLLKEQINSILDALSQEVKTAISLREFEGLSYDEIAKIMNCPVGTVRSRIFRAREMIEKELKIELNKLKVV